MFSLTFNVFVSVVCFTSVWMCGYCEYQDLWKIPGPDPPNCECSVPASQFLKQYLEPGCKGVYEVSTCCPFKFDCSNLKSRPTDKCTFGGKAYKVGQKLPHDVDQPCRGTCTCKKKGSKVKFECKDAPVCAVTLLKRDCVEIFDPKQCCPVAVRCTPPDPEEFVCRHKGNSYLVGQIMPKLFDPCFRCICQDGFTGELVRPWCVRKSCDLEMDYETTLRKGCVPIYHYIDTCCPVGWKCPTPMDLAMEIPKSIMSQLPPEFMTLLEIVRSNEPRGCLFGGLRMRVGQLMVPDLLNVCVYCACGIPPLPICMTVPQCVSLSFLSGS